MCDNMLLIIIFTNMVFLLPLNANVFSSKYDLESQIEMDAYIIKNLEKFISTTEPKKTKKLNIIKKYLNRCKEEYEIAIQDVEHYLANPINAYTLIKRHTLDLDYVEHLIGDSKDYTRNKSIKLTMDDLDTAIALFLKVQMVYQLNVTQLANGVLAGNYSKNRRPFIEHVTPMTASDCYQLCRSNDSYKDYRRNIAWLKEALLKLRSDPNDVSDVTKFDIIYQIVQIYTMMVDVDNAAKWMTKLMSLVTHDPSFTASHKHEEMIKQLLDHIGSIQTYKSEMPDFELYEEVASTCRGDDVSSVHNRSRPLTCVYAHWPHPFLMLARVKAEVLNYEPPVTMFYDVISNSEIEELQLMVKPKGHRNDELVSRISRRVEELTGLTMESSGSLYIVDNGLGVHYAKLNDASPEGKEDLKNKNTIAYVKFFLSNVDQGGASIFANIRLAVFPVKGAALYWGNLLPSGEWDDRSFQASCPVMRGNRWILTSRLYETESRSICAANGTSSTYSTVLHNNSN